MNDDHLPTDQQYRDAEDPGCAADVVPCGSRREVVVPSRAASAGERPTGSKPVARPLVRSAAITRARTIREWSSIPINALACVPSARANPPTTSTCHSWCGSDGAGAAAVDEVFASSQVAGVVGCQESDEVSDVGGISGSAKGDATDGFDDLCACGIDADL